MKTRQITTLPLKEIWNEHGTVSTTHIRELGVEEITALLRVSQVHFVVANVGSPLTWIPLAQCYTFWKSDVKIRLVEPHNVQEGFFSEDYPDGYCYTASEWQTNLKEPVILLSMYH